MAYMEVPSETRGLFQGRGDGDVVCLEFSCSIPILGYTWFVADIVAGVGSEGLRPH